MRCLGRLWGWAGIFGIVAILTACQPQRAAPGEVLRSKPSPSASPTRTATLLARPSPSETLQLTTVPGASTTARTRPSNTPASTPTPVLSATPTLPSLSSLSQPQTPVPGLPLAFSLGWRYDATGHLTASHLEMGDQSFYVVASLTRTVMALSPSGEVLWRARTRGQVYALTEVDGLGFVAGDDSGRVTLLDRAGAEQWVHEFGSRVTALEAVSWQEIPGRTGVLTGGWDERLTLLNPADQEQRVVWQADVPGPVSDIVAVDRPVPLAIVSTMDGQVQGIDAAGQVVWQFAVGAPLVSLDVLIEPEGDRILLGIQDGRLLALTAGGALLWQWDLGAASPVWHVMYQVGLPDIVAGTGGQSGALVCFSRSGQVQWHVSTGSAVEAVTSQDIDGDGEREIVAGLSTGEIWAFDTRGRVRGQLHAGLPVWGFEPGPDGSLLVRADVLLRQVVAGDGPVGGPWLPPPSMVTGPWEMPASVQAKDDEATLVFLGDVGLGRTMEWQLARNGPGFPWQGLDPVLSRSGGTPAEPVLIANLEGLLTTQGQPLNKSYLVRAHPMWSESLQIGGVDVVSLANNHALDYGQVGLNETLDVLRQQGIQPVGAGRSWAEAHTPAIVAANGIRIAVLAYAAERWKDSPDVPPTECLAWAEVAAVEADLQSVRERVDFVVVLLHAGTEYEPEPSPDQITFARAAIEAGADLVVGHHPHVVQTIERWNDGLIVYSLGDALFDIPRNAAMQGDLLRVHVNAEGMRQAERWPFWIDRAIQPRFLNNGQGAPQFEILLP